MGDDGFEEYVRVMSVVDREYESSAGKRLFRMPDEKMIAWFGLAITIELDRNTNPKRVYTEQVGLKLGDGTVADYSSAYDAITQGIMGDLVLDPLAQEQGRPAVVGLPLFCCNDRAAAVETRGGRTHCTTGKQRDVKRARATQDPIHRQPTG
jgi:hypothetical protein